jgi:hypothetical protein
LPSTDDGSRGSAAGREPGGAGTAQPAGGVPVRSGASIRREEGDESEFAGEIRERERDEPATERDDE